MDTNEKDNETEITIMSRTKEGTREEYLLDGRDPESKEVVRTLVESAPEEVLMETKLRGKRVFQIGG